MAGRKEEEVEWVKGENCELGTPLARAFMPLFFF